MSDEILPFRVEIAEADLENLRQRLRQTRWPEAATVTDWSQGVPLAYLQQLCHYWAEQYDWRSREKLLNRFGHYRTRIDDLAFHLSLIHI